MSVSLFCGPVSLCWLHQDSNEPHMCASIDLDRLQLDNTLQQHYWSELIEETVENLYQWPLEAVSISQGTLQYILWDQARS